MLAHFNIVDFDQSAALHAGAVRAHLEPRGLAIGPLDTLIAAHARSLGATIVTDNTREFSRVPGLKVRGDGPLRNQFEVSRGEQPDWSDIRSDRAIGPLDMLTAAHGRSLGATFVPTMSGSFRAYWGSMCGWNAAR